MVTYLWRPLTPVPWLVLGRSPIEGREKEGDRGKGRAHPESKTPLQVTREWEVEEREERHAHSCPSHHDLLHKLSPLPEKFAEDDATAFPDHAGPDATDKAKTENYHSTFL